MVGWVNMLMLTGLAALSVPIVIHLLRNRRFEAAELGSLRFLQQVVRERSKWRRLRHLLLLFLRLLAILLLVLLFARPYVVRPGTAADRDIEVVLLLDASGSTRGKVLGESLWQAVRDSVGDVRASLADSARLTTAVFADAVIRIDEDVSVEPAAGAGTDYALALRWAADHLRTSTAAYRDVMIVTDLQKTGLPTLPLDDWPPDVPVHIRALPAPGDFNVAIGGVRCLTPVPEGDARFAVRLVCSGDVPESPLEVSFLIEGGRDIRRTVLPQTQEAIFSWPNPSPGVCRGRVRVVSDDAWPDDDALDFAFELRHPLQVAILDGSRPRVAQDAAAYFLATALSKERDGDGRAAYQLTTLPDLSTPAAVHAVIAAHPSAADTQALERLAGQVRAGTGLLLFLGDWMDMTTAAAWRDAGLLPCALTRTPIPVPEVISAWDDTHPMMQAFGSAETGELSRIVFRDAFQLEVQPPASVVASLAGGNAAVVTGTLGEGRIVVVSNPCGRAWTDWPVERIYLPLVREMTAFVSRLRERRGRLRTGRASILAPLAPGIHEHGEVEVIFPDPDEVFVERCSEDEFRLALGIGQAPAGALDAPDAVLPAGRERPNELWRWLALALAAVLFVESLTVDWPRGRRVTSR